MADRQPALRASHVALLSALVAGTVAAPAVLNGYVEDAHWIIEQRPPLAHPSSFGALLLEPYWPRTFGGALWPPAVLASSALARPISACARWLHAVDVPWTAPAARLLALGAAARA